MLDAVQLVGILTDNSFVGKWRIGESLAWLNFEFHLSNIVSKLPPPPAFSFQGYFELANNKKKITKVEETFSLTRARAEEPPNDQVENFQGEGSNQFGQFSIIGQRNPSTLAFQGSKQYTIWAADEKKKKATPRRRRKKRKADEEEEDESVQLLPPPLLPMHNPDLPPTLQSRARAQVRNFVLALPNYHFFPYDVNDRGEGLARKRHDMRHQAMPPPVRVVKQPRVQSHAPTPPSSTAMPIVLPTEIHAPPAPPELFRALSTCKPPPLPIPSSTFFAPPTTTATLDETDYVSAKFETDGSVYEGQILANLRHGFGVCGYWNGQMYIGNFKKGLEHGMGELREPNGALIYRGMFEHGKINGNGTMYYLDGAIYQGEMRESTPSGKGVMWYSDDESCFEGDFFHGARCGYGKFSNPKGQYFGEWMNDVRHGSGRLALENGLTLDGTFKDNAADGRCNVRYANADLYEGNFKDGLREGRGTYSFTNRKSKLEGRFSKDEAIAKSGTLELDEHLVIELPNSTDTRLSEWLVPIKDPNESHLTAGFDKDGT